MRQRAQRDFEPIGLRLVAGEQQHGRVRRFARCELLDIDGVRQHLPRPAGRSEELICGPLAELALVEDMVGGEQRTAERFVDPLGLVARPAGIRHTALVEDDRNVAPACEREQRAGIAR